MTLTAAPTSPTAGRRAAKKPGSATDTPQPGAWSSRIVGQGAEDPTQLVANPRNWRIHPKGQQDALGSVLDEVGWVQQVLVNRTTGNVVDGHLRVELAIGRDEPAVPVLYVELSEQEEALVLASLDPLSAMAATDEDKLRELLAGVTIEQADLAAMMAGLVPAEPKGGLTDPDDVPEVPDEPYVQSGDLYLLGEHRLLCGDATTPSTMWHGSSTALDPASWSPTHPMGSTTTRRGDGERPASRARAAPRGPRRQRRSGRLVSSVGPVASRRRGRTVHGRWLHAGTVAEGLQRPASPCVPRSSGPSPRWSWAAATTTGSTSPVWYVVREGRAARRTRDRTQSTVWEMDGVRTGATHDEDEATDHGTQKPIEAMARPMRNHEPTDVLRPLRGLGHHHHRRRADRAPLLRHGHRPPVRPGRQGTLGGLHGPGGRPWVGTARHPSPWPPSSRAARRARRG